VRLSMIVISLALCACGGKKDEGPSCEAVTDHILAVTKQNLPGHENTNLGNQRKAMIDQCEKKQMPSEVRTCILGAKTISEIAKCRGRGGSNVLERPRRPRGSAGGSAEPARAGSAGSGAGSSAGSATGSGSGSGSGGSGSGSGSGTRAGSAR
jgi:hypothetical protein